ncbi:dihydropteroate synthase [Gammaproteobacteria bacterium]|uniref:dihydropteroate synthase n=1 Tax=OM182 bacterium MED-G28 TaxID=1986256 RepID=A0A2A5WBF7_9GAMM|nr:dihydropteroate synthase [Gammaproteobacteria bacterium]MDC0222314.1 dihydropteroate synthase [Gammaproteobacteria bacterium]PDH33633.1 MAG: dihydropteroate synthase [OM182 bacterium MED-G28]
MGIINATPDSFSDGSEFASAKVSHFVIDVDKVLGRVKTLIDEGARIIDIGGESTRPGAVEVSVEEELARVIPLIEAIRNNFDVCISVDTSSAVVMSEAINAGAELVNDIRALTNPETLAVIANSKAAICLMHMQGQPRTMQQEYHYENVVTDVIDFLKQRIEACENAGITKERLLVDPGFGFGKSLEHNFQLLRNLTQFSSLKLPILVGISRKSMIGRLVNRPPRERVAGSLAATVLALENGALIVRTHDVAATVDAIRVHSMYTQAL